MPYPNEHSCRLEAPGEGPFRRKAKAAKIGGRCVDHIYERRDGRMILQAVRFPRAAGWDGEAATREARDWCREHGGRFEAMREEDGAETAAADQGRICLYVQGPIAVRIEEGSDGEKYLVDLPLMRIGRWNGEEYDADRLRALVRNHGLIAEAEAIVPALKSRHTYSGGAPENVDAAQVTLGWIEGLRYDDARGVLLGRVRVVSDRMLEDILAGRLRYISAEIMPNYRLANGEEIGPALVGAAWVDWPAVRGLPWEIVLNREEWAEDLSRGEAGDPDPGGNGDAATADTTGEQKADGGVAMSRWTRFIDVLAGLFAGREKPEALEEFRDLPLDAVAREGGEHGAGADSGETAVLAQAGPEAAGPEAAQSAAAEIELLREAHRAAEARIAELEKAYRAAQIENLVGKLVAAGAVRPAVRREVESLLDILLQSDREVQILRDGATEPEKMKPAELLVRILRDSAPKLSGEPLGRAYPGLGEEDEGKPRIYTEDELDRLVQLANK